MLFRSEDVESPVRREVEALVSLQSVQLIELLLWNVECLEVALDSRIGHTLGQHDMSLLNTPTHKKLASILTQTLRDLLDFGIVYRPWLTGLVVAQWRISLNEDLVLVAELTKLRLLQVRVCFNLVDNWDIVGL